MGEGSGVPSLPRGLPWQTGWLPNRALTPSWHQEGPSSPPVPKGPPAESPGANGPLFLGSRLGLCKSPAAQGQREAAFCPGPGVGSCSRQAGSVSRGGGALQPWPAWASLQGRGSPRGKGQGGQSAPSRFPDVDGCQRGVEPLPPIEGGGAVPAFCVVCAGAAASRAGFPGNFPPGP